MELRSVTLHVVKKPLSLDDLRAAFSASGASLDSHSGWAVLLHISDGNKDLPISLLLRGSSVEVRDSRRVWKAHRAVQDDDRIVSVTGVSSDADVSELQLQCRLRDDLIVNLSHMQGTELGFNGPVSIPYEEFRDKLCTYIAKNRPKPEIYDHLIMKSSPVLTFQLSEATQTETGVCYWTFDLPVPTYVIDLLIPPPSADADVV